mmetsp:Transcript_23871/g.46890  ORF Transcript_23871/g.46890 Transcript_23871/m.46890 type:complete len:230 (-) Transcript_23871:478-1167(-)
MSERASSIFLKSVSPSSIPRSSDPPKPPVAEEEAALSLSAPAAAAAAAEDQEEEDAAAAAAEEEEEKEDELEAPRSAAISSMSSGSMSPSAALAAASLLSSALFCHSESFSRLQMSSSTVFVEMNRQTCTVLVWPCRRTLPIACHSKFLAVKEFTAFIGCTNKTWLAACRFDPEAEFSRERKRTQFSVFLGSRKWSMVFLLRWIDPSSVEWWMEKWFRALETFDFRSSY